MSAFVLLGASTVSNAQTANPVKVKVNVNLNSFQSIEIGSGATPGGGYGDEVTLEYKTAEDYRNGVSKLVAKQLKVTSIGSGYKIKASLSDLDDAPTDYLKRNTGSAGVETIKASDILKIKVGAGAVKDAFQNIPEWTFSDQTSSGQSSVLDQELDVKYIGERIDQANLRDYFNNVGKESIRYSVVVTYSIETN
ncbi:hypothetical protein [Sphingobacterium sp. SGL-16]|uniref:hypothetical protein n=1 Tax=Sphingobacterium sp. SGL-16 TaxID=2710883 RepID=UPI0019D04F94|nr:hypothetical protein [Sphingobacterium sp. SGL-16]